MLVQETDGMNRSTPKVSGKPAYDHAIGSACSCEEIADWSF
ncbi:MAG: hypothetical protein N0E48_07140 [Candidatus Thiodiazotropha endolucinida]|nr:hypothetical protein [Candidatus Thiodiazotropha endolucinida]MCW4334876.1 hypothetical protein [Candidatus Thiodiazotropha endolucinida]MCW4343119.1 hypothetical protein [Candidatus Thiodiazotropha endolucinida]